jgi:hypothetical protein
LTGGRALREEVFKLVGGSSSAHLVNVVAKSLDLNRPAEVLSQRVRAVDEDPSA